MSPSTSPMPPPICAGWALASSSPSWIVPTREAAVRLLTAAETHHLVAATEVRHLPCRHPEIAVEVERPQAEFASWYELFPRSLGTFNDVIAHLPRVRDMGFDVLYFPPIHPIGTTNRKGRNNSLKPAPDDPGSPYAIGARDGGHDAIHAALGTPEDFRRLVAAAREHGLEIALDFAIQCSPDHPWLTPASRMVPPPRRRLDPLRRESAQEVRGHRQCRLLRRRRDARAVAGVARCRAALGRRRRADLPRRQSAHQAAALLGMDDRRCPRPPSRCDLPGRGLHAADHDVSPRPRSASRSPTPTSPGATPRARSPTICAS